MGECGNHSTLHLAVSAFRAGELSTALKQVQMCYSLLLVQNRDFSQFDPVEWSEGVPALQKIPLLVPLPSKDQPLRLQCSALVWRSVNFQWIQLFLRVK